MTRIQKYAIFVGGPLKSPNCKNIFSDVEVPLRPTSPSPPLFYFVRPTPNSLTHCSVPPHLPSLSQSAGRPPRLSERQWRDSSLEQQRPRTATGAVVLASCSGGDHVTMSGDHDHSGSVQWIHCWQAQEGRICCRRAREGRICCWQTREGRIRCLARERLIRPRVWRKGGRRTACDHGTRSSDHDHDGCACGLGSDRSVAGGLRKGGSAAAWLENGGSTLACSRDKGGVVTVEAEKPWQQWPHCDLARALVFFLIRRPTWPLAKIGSLQAAFLGWLYAKMVSHAVLAVHMHVKIPIFPDSLRPTSGALNCEDPLCSNATSSLEAVGGA